MNIKKIKERDIKEFKKKYRILHDIHASQFNYLNIKNENMKKQEFEKDDLQTGMLVEYRYGVVAMVNDNVFTTSTSFTEFNDFNQDLTCRIGDPSFDIIRVSKKLEGNLLIPKYWTKETLNSHLLWERNESKREIIIIGGIKYYKDKIENALKNIEPVK